MTSEYVRYDNFNTLPLRLHSSTPFRHELVFNSYSYTIKKKLLFLFIGGILGLWKQAQAQTQNMLFNIHWRGLNSQPFERSSI